MRRLVMAGALAFAAVMPVLAADLPQPPPPQAPAVYVPTVVPVYNWGGIYFGINGGYAFGTSNWKDPANASGLGQTGNFSTSGFVVGPTLGANLQYDAFVFGVEGDFDYSGLDGKSSSPFCGGPGPLLFPAAGALGLGIGAQCETKNTWLATLRGRAGYAVDRVLFYGTAGGALGNVETGANTGLKSSTKAGWTAGAGIEAALADNWTARIEYLYVDLGNSTCNVANPCGLDPPFPPPGVAIPANQSVSFTTSLIRAGIDYKFR